MSTTKQVLKVSTYDLVLTWDDDDHNYGLFERDGEIILDFERMEVGDSLQNKMHPEWKVTDDKPHFIVSRYIDTDATIEINDNSESIEYMIEDAIGEEARIVFSDNIEYAN